VAALTYSSPELRGKVVKCRTFLNFAVIESRYSPGERLSQHCHSRAFISITLTGSYSEDWGSVPCDYTAGQTIFHASGESHSNRFGDRGAELLNVMIYPNVLGELRQLGVDPDIRSVCESEYSLQLAIKLRHEAFFVHDLSSGLVSEGLAMELCGEIFRCQTRDVNCTSHWLDKVDSILRARFREPVTLADLAGTVGVHPVHLARAFRKRFGHSVGEQIRKLRTEEACRELWHSQLPIAEIAARAGFSDQSHLSRTLKRYIGMSPREFRSRPAKEIDPTD